MNFRGKIIAWDKLPEWRKTFRASGKKLVVTNPHGIATDEDILF